MGMILLALVYGVIGIFGLMKTVPDAASWLFICLATLTLWLEMVIDSGTDE